MYEFKTSGTCSQRILFDIEDGKVKIWERGRQFISKLQGLINRYNPLEEKVFEIERHGKAGETSTKYEIYPLDGVESVNLDEVEIRYDRVLYMTKEEAIIEMMRFRTIFPKAIAQNREMDISDFIIKEE